ncbi:type II toxin-antitoxin system HicA family toxin [Campylobacter hepaticus]
MSAKEKLIKSLKNNPKNVDFSVLKNLLLIMAMSVFIRVARIINLEKKDANSSPYLLTSYKIIYVKMVLKALEEEELK